MSAGAKDHARAVVWADAAGANEIPHHGEIAVRVSR